MKRNKPRSNRRRNAARKRQTKRAASRSAGRTAFVGSVFGTVPGVADGELHDDCPICRAMAAVGATPDSTGAVEMSDAQFEAYQKEVRRIIDEEGMPEEAVIFDPGGLLTGVPTQRRN